MLLQGANNRVLFHCLLSPPHLIPGIGGGVESMSLNPMHKPPPGFVVNPRAFEVDNARDCLVPMGITSENVAER